MKTVNAYHHREWRCYVGRADYDTSVSLYLARYVDDGNGTKREVVGPMRVAEISDVTPIQPEQIFYRCDDGAFGRLGEIGEILQAIVDEAWKHGIRPTGVEIDNKSELSATKAHLADMRAIAFTKTNVTQP